MRALNESREARGAKERNFQAASGETYVLSGSGEDCPPHTFPIQSRRECEVAAQVINTEGLILVTPASAKIGPRNEWGQRPNGCILHCPRLADCTVYFNDAPGAINATDRKVRRYCQDHFDVGRGRCRVLTGGLHRNIISRGTFASVEACKVECIRGPLHAQWCEAFEVVDPFKNECLFFKSGYVGDGSVDARCYVRAPSTH